MTEVLLSFDTEDYISPASDDSVLRLSEVLKSEGVKGCFNMVAELSNKFVERKRFDVINSLASHEIDYHSFRHSWHPTIVEYTDTEDWNEGYNRFISEESTGVGIVKDVFKRDRIWAYVPPGNCISSQSLYGYSEMGIKICSGSLFKGTSGKGIWFCNSLNLENNCYLDSLLLEKGIDGIYENIDTWRNWRRLIICCHPNIIYHTVFWDIINLNGGNLVNWGEWKIPEKRPDSVIDKFFADFRQTLRMLKTSGGFKFVTYEDIWREQESKNSRVITYSMLIDFLNRVKGRFFYVEHNNYSYSLSDIFFAAVHLLCKGKGEYEVKDSIGPLDEPVAITEDVTVKAEKIREAALRLSALKTVPYIIHAGDVCMGPGDFIEAARQVFSGKDPVLLSPGPQLPDTEGYYRFNNFQLINTWLYPQSFKDKWVTKRLKLQSWTIRSE